MQFLYSSKFKKQFKKFPKKIRIQAINRLELLTKNEFHQLLSNHKLHGELGDYRSIAVTGDIRIIYKKMEQNMCYLIAIGPHSELYE